MKKRRKINPFFGFSYLDAVLFLVIGLILSVGIYLYSEEKQKEMNRDFYLVQVELFYEEELLPYVPQKGEALFDGEGREIGTVESVLPTEEEGHVLVHCRVEESALPAGDTFGVETALSVKYGNILSKEQILNEKEGAA